MNRLTIIDTLGSNADLLTKSDKWLAAKKEAISQQLSLLLSDLRTITKATKIKSSLQQKNMVPLRTTIMEGDDTVDEIIRIMPLPDAISEIVEENTKNPNNAKNQIATWVSDGYDIETAKEMRY